MSPADKETQKPNAGQQIILMICVAIFIVIALILKNSLGYQSFMSSIIFGACGGGLGGIVGGLLAQVAAPKK